ncbi:AAA ATPase domain-containing protein, partial [Streptomyces sp. DvalAA-14]|uniref:AAA family ATPase n=1 Tax=unclassified Streptomyces TaxID=2593676 RepID=UPI00081B85EA
MRGSPYPQGRTTDREALLAAAGQALTAGTSVLLLGEAGIGRSTFLDRLTAEQAAAGRRILRSRPAPDERRLPHLGLIDLLADVSDAFLAGPAGLAAPEQELLRTALHRRTAPDLLALGSPDAQLSLHLAVLKTLTALGADTPVLITVDDARWLDPPTAGALAFAARRARRLPLTVLATGRIPDNGELGSVEALLPEPALRLAIPPMSERETTALLGAAELPSWPHPLPARIAQTAAGNPYVALELARALAAAGHPPGRPDPGGPLPVPAGVRALLLDRLAPLSARARRTLLAAGAADRPTVRLLRRAGCEHAPEDLAEAVALGILEAPGPGPLRFSQPLMPRVVYEAATAAGRRRAHAALAEAAE